MTTAYVAPGRAPAIKESVFDERTCDVLAVLTAILAKSWVGDEIGGGGTAKGGKGLAKVDVRDVSCFFVLS